MNFVKLARAAGVFALFVVSAAWADPPQILIPHGPPAHAPAHGFRSLGHPVRVNTGVLSRLGFNEEAELRLPNAMRHTFVFELNQSPAEGIRTFVGHLKGKGNHYRAIVTTGPSGSFGVFSTPEGDFRLIPGEGHDWLVDMVAEQEFIPISYLGNDIRVSPENKALRGVNEPTALYLMPGVNTIAVPKAAPTPAYGVDLMFVVTRGLANRLGGGLMTRLHFLVARANTSYVDSEVSIVLRLVGVTIVDYPDTGDNGDALGAITPDCLASNPNCGVNFDAATFGNIETLRNANGADLVAFLRNGGSNSGSGVAWIGGYNGTAITNPRFMYSVTTGCVVGCESVFIHEVGHNMGNFHDRSTASWQGGGDPDGDLQGSAYGYYFCSSGTLSCNPNIPPGLGGCASNSQPECSSGASGTNNFSEIMSYFQGSTTKNYKFSSTSPTVTCIGNTGPALSCGAANADTASSMNLRRAALSAIKNAASATPVPTPGSLQFNAPAYSATESAGSVTVSVSRLGGTSGAVSVQLTTTNGTAIAGSDYTAQNVTLNWADGDSANKTVNIAIANDGVTEGSEAFTVSLANPTGTAGVFLGQPNVATVIITEPWPPGGTTPSGFTTVSGPAWAVATDSSSDGDNVSFKSGDLAFQCPPTCGGPPPVPPASTTQYSATFAGGTLAFSYKVDSHPGTGFFEFLVDGVVTASASGSVDWTTFSMTLPAGAHTLQWRYRTTFYARCSITTVNGVPAPTGAACSDRAWIDGLVLPLTGGGGPFALTVSLAGGGTGTVTSAPAGINCGSDCTESYSAGTPVTLTATPTAGSTFTGWTGGGCSGTGQCTVTMNTATNVTATFASSANPPRLFGISTRMNVQLGDNVMIGGFIIGGGTPKTVVVRARGPSLGVAGGLADPVMTIVPAAGGPPLVNDDWQTDANAATLQASGFAPGNVKESAILATLNPGAYTAIVSGVGNTTGVAIVEVYEIAQPEAVVVGISTRGLVQTGDNVLIGGFIIQGDGPQTVVIRARGPSLGVAGALADTILTVVPAAGGPNLVNDDWQTDPNYIALQASGFAPGHHLESAILVTLNPGAYTAIVTGYLNTTGVAIVEVYRQ